MNTTVHQVTAPDKAMFSPHRLRLLILLCSLLAAAGLVYITQWGIGTSPDSVAYIHQARLLSEGGSVFEMGTQWPPLYSLLLAGTAVISGDPLLGARWLQALLFGANVALFGTLLYQATRKEWLAVSGVLILLSAVPLLTVHAFAWSEAAFLFLVMAGLALLAYHLARPRPIVLLLAGVTAGLACLTRYAGLPLVAAGTTLLLLRHGLTLGRRLAAAMLFAATAMILPLFWFAAVLLGGGSASRALAFHPIGRAQVWQASYTISDWLHMPPGMPDIVGVILLAGLLLLAVTAVVLWWRRYRRAALTWRAALTGLLLLFSLFYLAFLALTISVIDANTPLDDRILVPVYMIGLFFVLLVIDSALDRLAKSRLFSTLLVVAIALFLTVQFTGAASWIREQRSAGLGYSSPGWQQSATLVAVRALPADVVIYSNAPEAIDLFARREALSLPRKNAAMLGERNAGYQDEIAALQRAVEAGAVLVYFDVVGNRPVASASELEQRMLLATAQRLDDGTMLVAGPVE